MTPTLRVATALMASLFAFMAYAEMGYWRCANPPDKCIAFSEVDKADCPECKEWKRVFLDFSIVMRDARREQKEAGVATPGVASNFFLDAASEHIYGVDLTTTAGSPPKTSDIYKNPRRYGLVPVAAREVNVGTLAVVGNVAGVVTEKDGALVITYSGGKTGEIKTATAVALAAAEREPVRYLIPEQRQE